MNVHRHDGFAAESKEIVEYPIKLGRTVNRFLVGMTFLLAVVLVVFSAVKIRERLKIERDLRRIETVIGKPAEMAKLASSLIRGEVESSDIRLVNASLVHTDLLGLSAAHLRALRAENWRGLAFDMAVRILPFIVCSFAVFFILGHLRRDFLEFMLKLRARESQIAKREHSKALVLDVLSESVLEYDVSLGEWVTLSDRFGALLAETPEAGDFERFATGGLAAWLDLIHPDDRLTAKSRLAALLEREIGFRETVRIRRFDGEYRDHEITATIWIDGETADGIVAISHRDVTERKQAERDRLEHERSLFQARERMNLALDASKMGIWDWDLLGNRLEWDSRVRGLFSFPDGEAPSLEYFRSRVHPDDLARLHQDMDRSVKERREFRSRFRVRGDDGAYFHLQSIGEVRLDMHGVPTRLIGLCWDITEEVENESELARARQSQVQSARMASLGEMASGIAHEINNPLGVIAARAYLARERLSRGESPDTVREDLRKIEENGFRISKIVKGMKNLARDGSEDPFMPIGVQELFDEGISFCRERFKKRNIDLRVNAAVPPGLRFECRSTQVSQVLLNLLNNAVDAVDGSEKPWTEVRVWEEESLLHLVVVDSGPGVAADLEMKIMEPFFTTKEVGKGSGLGLSISCSIARQHHGRLYLDRSIGPSAFHLEIPMRQPRPNRVERAVA